MPKPLDQVLPPEERDEVRRQALAQHGRFYSPWVHLGTTTVFGLGVIGLAISRLDAVRWWEWLAALGLLILSNASEWRIHRDLLHRRTRGLEVMYDRHTPEHHVIYVTDDMAIRSNREFALVLIPPWGIIAAFVGLTPLYGGLWLLGQHNLGALFCIVTIGYVVSYEWFHLSYHLRPDSLVGSLWLVKVLRTHHAIHHDPRLMQKWNFNVTVPLWDLVRRTYVRDREAALATRREAPAGYSRSTS